MKKLLLKFLLIGVLTVTGCCSGGAGGSSVIHGMVMHHEAMIPNTTIYIKYKAKELPSTDVSKYDAHVQAGSDAMYTVSGLECGDYYLYGVGIDPSLIAPDNIVKGGVHVKITKDGTTTETDVFVTED